MTKVTLTTGKAKASSAFLGLGRKIEATNVEDALRQAGLNWTVSKRPVLTTSAIPVIKPKFDKNGIPLPNGNPALMTPNGTERIGHLRHHLERLLRYPEDPSIKAEVAQILEETEDSYIPHKHDFSIVRNDTNRPFGVLGRIYECLDNHECIAILKPLLDKGKVTIERAGVFNDGANVWILVKFPSSMTVGTEELDQYMKISWSHDGSEKLSATFIAYLRRSNTQINPTVPGEQVSIEIRHTTNAKKRMALAQNLLEKGATYFKALEDKLVEMINLPWNDKEMEEYLEALLPDSTKNRPEPTTGKLKETQAGRKRGEVLEIFQQSDNTIEGTKYAGFAAVAQWCDHDKPTRVTGVDEDTADDVKEELRKESRLQSIWRGTSRNLKDAAFKLIIK